MEDGSENLPTPERVEGVVDKIVSGAFGEEKLKALVEADAENKLNGPEGKYQQILDEIENRFEGQVTEIETKIKELSTYKSPEDNNDVDNFMRDKKGLKDLVGNDPWLLAKDLVCGKNAFEHPGGGSVEAVPEKSGFYKNVLENPETEERVRLDMPKASEPIGKKEVAEIRQDVAIRIMAIVSLVSNSLDVNSISQSDATFLNKVVSSGVEGIESSDVIGISDPEAIGRGVVTLWVAQRLLDKTLDQALRKRFGVKKGRDQKYKEYWEDGHFSLVKSDFALPEKMRKDLLPNAYDLRKINGFAGLIDAYVSDRNKSV